MDTRPIKILLVEDNEQFAKLVTLYLQKYDDAAFEVSWVPNGDMGLRTINDNQTYDLILMDYFLPRLTGFEVTRKLYERDIRIPIVFLTANREFDLVLEVMKLGVEDYLVKEEILSPALPKTILSVLERRDLRKRLQELEISKKRLEAVQELALSVSSELEQPLRDLRTKVHALRGKSASTLVKGHLDTIGKSLDRIEQKLRRLKQLKEARSVPYVKGVRMIDISDGEGSS
jgi:CheY-like chemotaxis protein